MKNKEAFVYPNFLETLLQGNHCLDEPLFTTPRDYWFRTTKRHTVIIEPVFKSELFQTLLEDKINGLY